MASGALLTPDNIDRLIERPQRSKGSPRALQFSPDGRWLAVTWTGSLTLYDACTLEERASTSLTGALAFSPDSQLLAVSNERAIQVRRATDLAILYTLPYNGSNYTNVLRFSPDGTLLAAAGNSTITLYRARDGLRERELTGHQDTVSSLAFAPDGTSLISSDSGSTQNHQVRSFTIKRWRVGDGALLASTSPADGVYVRSLLSSDGRLVVTRYYLRIMIWRFEADALVRIREIPSGIVLAFSADNSEVLISDAGKLERRDVTDGLLIATLGGYPNNITHADYGADRSTIAALDYGGALRFLRAADGMPLGGISVMPVAERPIAFTPDSTMLISSATRADTRGVLHLWRLADGMLLRTIVTDGQYIKALAISHDGAIIASSSANYGIQLWRASDGTPIRTLEGQKIEAEEIALSPDGQLLAAEVASREIGIWRISDGQLLTTFKADGLISRVTFSPDSALLLGAAEGRVVFHNAADGTVVGEIATTAGIFTRPAGFLAGGTVLITSERGAFRLWDWASQSPLRDFRFEETRTASSAFSPGGQLLALATYDGQITFLRVSDGTTVHSMTLGATTLIRFTPDGTTFIAVGNGGAVQLWDVPR